MPETIAAVVWKRLLEWGFPRTNRHIGQAGRSMVRNPATRFRR
jgi:hypothetical protein